MASGAVSSARVRNTAVPGTRCTGGSMSRRWRTKSSRGPSSSLRLRVTITRPCCQVNITVKMAPATTSGSQPPVWTLVRFDVRKPRSTTASRAASGAYCHSGRSPRRRRTMKNSSAEIVIVPQAATP